MGLFTDHRIEWTEVIRNTARELGYTMSLVDSKRLVDALMDTAWDIEKNPDPKFQVNDQVIMIGYPDNYIGRILSRIYAQGQGWMYWVSRGTSYDYFSTFREEGLTRYEPF